MSDRSFQRGSILAYKWRVYDIFSVIKLLHDPTYLIFIDFDYHGVRLLL